MDRNETDMNESEQPPQFESDGLGLYLYSFFSLGLLCFFFVWYYLEAFGYSQASREGLYKSLILMLATALSGCIVSLLAFRRAGWSWGFVFLIPAAIHGYCFLAFSGSWIYHLFEKALR